MKRLIALILGLVLVLFIGFAQAKTQKIYNEHYQLKGYIVTDPQGNKKIYNQHWQLKRYIIKRKNQTDIYNQHWKLKRRIKK